MGAAAVVGSLLLILGFTVLRLGEHAVEIRIRYGGAARTGSVPFQMQADAVEHMADCDVSSGTCSLQVSLSRDMPPPVRVLYHLDPFYQNFPTYIASGLQPKSADFLAQMCTLLDQVRPPVHGENCHKPFNDTFELRRNGAVLYISKDGVGNPEDRSRMANPPDYPDRSKVVRNLGGSWQP
ncbi:ALIS3 [Symbiodinium sp. CCMP2592]|nr:ALIS3 [Symbiodinium sp. CCMP2592]